MRLACVLLVLGMLTRIARADCADDPYCKDSKVCCDQVKCDDPTAWRTRFVKRDGCARSAASGERVPQPDHPACGRMTEWQLAEVGILKAYLDQSLMLDALKNGSSIAAYQNAVAAKAGTAVSADGRAEDVMSTGADCQVKNVERGCAWLRSKNLPPIACEMAEMHEKVHAAQCTATGGPPKTVLDASIRELIAHIGLLRAITAWIEGSCSSSVN